MVDFVVYAHFMPMFVVFDIEKGSLLENLRLKK